MNLINILPSYILQIIVVTKLCTLTKTEVSIRNIPTTLLLGSASSSYQIEGAWNEDGKGESIWDHMTHFQPHKIKDRSNGDIACDSYHKTKEDVALMKDMGLEFYRFSISWPRILPYGFPNKINQAGVNYYNELIDELLANNIKPVVTIYHWDLPQALQNLGGWTNPQIIHWFENFASIVFKEFGNKVKTWVTINEPKQICNFGYGVGIFAPGIQQDGVANYLCVRNVLLAHAHVYHLYNKVFRPVQKGRIGITMECSWSEAKTRNEDDVDAAQRYRQFDFGVYANPIFHKNGDYPKCVKERIEKRSRLEGFLKSRLPQFTTEEIDLLKGTSDFFGLNHYTEIIISEKQNRSVIGNPSWDTDVEVDVSEDPHPTIDWLGYFKLAPWAFRKVLNYVKDNYNNPEIFIMENGFPDVNVLIDETRLKYYRENLNAVLDAITIDGVNITAYTAWSFFDSFEWGSGYAIGFGFYQINFTDPSRPRIPKSSANFFKEIIRTRQLAIE